MNEYHVTFIVLEGAGVFRRIAARLQGTDPADAFFTACGQLDIAPHQVINFSAMMVDGEADRIAAEELAEVSMGPEAIGPRLGL